MVLTKSVTITGWLVYIKLFTVMHLSALLENAFLVCDERNGVGEMVRCTKGLVKDGRQTR